MKKLEKTLDSNNRIKIPSELLKLAKLEDKKELAFCQIAEGLNIRAKNDIKDRKVLGTATMDAKKRFVIPKYLRGGKSKFEIFVFNEELVIKEAE